MHSRKVRIIVGLGNHGKAYCRHRHNIGFMVVDKIAAEAGAKWATNRERTLVSELEIEGERVLLVKPQTFMNLSGKAVGPIVRREDHEAASRMIVIHDELDIAAGKVKLKVGGGDGGHKGIRSIADSLRFRDFFRVRLGIGRPPVGAAPDQFVLTSFAPDELSVCNQLIDKGCYAVSMIISQGLDKAQMLLHGQKETVNS